MEDSVEVFAGDLPKGVTEEERKETLEKFVALLRRVLSVKPSAQSNVLSPASASISDDDLL